jgi:acetylornithine/N-succinyldiaminopimelate aminotransferase
MIGIELALKCAPVVEYARVNGVLLNCTSDCVLRLVPPLVITTKQIDRVTEVIEKGIQEAK